MVAPPVNNRPAGPAKQITHADDMPAGLYEALKVAFEKDRALPPYQIIPQATVLTNCGASYKASNPRQQFQIDFTEEAIWVKPGERRKSKWELGFSVRAYGYTGDLKPVGAAQLSATANRLDYQRAGLTEWYINDARGLEQGFTLESPPDSRKRADNSLLQIEMSLMGNLHASLAANGQTVNFSDANHCPILGFSKFFAFDARGRNLPVSFSLAGDKLMLNIDDTTAEYPLTIDPLLHTQQEKLRADDGALGDIFGYSVAIDGDTAIIAARGDDDKGSNSGSAYVFVRSGSDWNQQAKLTAGDGAANDWFGHSVAISGDTAIVAARGDDDKGSMSGSAYVFVRSGSDWSQQAKLTAGDGAANDHFGYSVAIDDNKVIVGAPGDDDKGSMSGSAYVFVYNGNEWIQEKKLTADDGAGADYFGRSVDIDGNTVIVGAFRDNDKGSLSGSAYVFVRSGSDWSQQAKLTAGDGAAKDYFGYSVAISGDRAIVGAYLDDDKGSSSGSAYVFVRSDSSWSQQAKLTAADGAESDIFGWSVAIDGNIAIVAARGDDDKGSASGSAYVFVYNGNDWIQEKKLTAGDGAANDSFGHSVAISGDTAIFGAHGDDDKGSASGSAYIFKLPALFPFSNQGEMTKLLAYDWTPTAFFGCSVAIEGDTAIVGAYEKKATYVFVKAETGWIHQAKLTPGTGGRDFGGSVAISGDTVIVGAKGDGDNGPNSGAAYVFVKREAGWIQQEKLLADDGDLNNRFGCAVAIDGHTAIVGSYTDTISIPAEQKIVTEVGSAYVFTRSGDDWSQKQKLEVDDDDKEKYAHFGYSVAIDGDTAIVGASQDDSKKGSAYVFVYDGNKWIQEQKLIAGDGAAKDEFGCSVAIDGNRAIVGAKGANRYAQYSGDPSYVGGLAFVFLRSGGVWSQEDQLSAADGVARDEFGCSVAIDGNRAIVGISTIERNAGAVYVFVRNGSDWTPQEENLTAGDRSSPDRFGSSVAMDGDTAIVGAYLDDDKGWGSGAAYIVKLTT